MIGMPIATPPGRSHGLPAPAAAAAAVPPGDLAAADLGFDDVFRQLTGGLLATVAPSGAAPVARDAEATVDEGDEVDPTSAPLPFGIAPASIVFTLPAAAPSSPVPPAGAGGDIQTVGAADSTATSVVATDSAPATGPIANSTTWDAAPVDADTAAPTGAPSREVADSDVLAAVMAPAPRAGSTSPATASVSPAPTPHGPRPGEETPGRPRTGDTPTTDTSPSRPVAPAAAAVHAQSEPPRAPAEARPVDAAVGAREMPVTAERSVALQRALAQQAENTHRHDVAPGLAAQVGQALAVPPGGGTDAGADEGTAGKKSGRAWPSGPAPGAALPVTASVTAPMAAAGGLAHDATPASEPAASAPAASRSWRVAASPALTDSPLPASETARATGAPGLIAGQPPTVEPMPVLRDRAAADIDVPHAVPELDPATGEAVHAQIVKSIRMQWTGGLGEARVTLKPEFLGDVTASISVDRGVVTATLQADAPEVRRFLESHTATLRDALVDHGLRLDRLTVGEPERPPSQGERHAKPRQHARPPSPRPRARRDASDTDTPFDVTTD